VCEPIFNKPLAEISFAQVLMRLFRVAQRFEVEVQPQLILLHKTLFNIEGLGRELYPELDLWKTAHPVMRRWMAERVGPQAFVADLRENLPALRDALRALPDAIRLLAERASNGNPAAEKLASESRLLRDELAAVRKQVIWFGAAAAAAIVVAALVIIL
jgi:ubiquinone biosynthesis protein